MTSLRAALAVVPAAAVLLTGCSTAATPADVFVHPSGESPVNTVGQIQPGFRLDSPDLSGVTQIEYSELTDLTAHGVTFEETLNIVFTREGSEQWAVKYTRTDRNGSVDKSTYACDLAVDDQVGLFDEGVVLDPEASASEWSNQAEEACHTILPGILGAPTRWADPLTGTTAIKKVDVNGVETIDWLPGLPQELRETTIEAGIDSKVVRSPLGFIDWMSGWEFPALVASSEEGCVAIEEICQLTTVSYSGAS